MTTIHRSLAPAPPAAHDATRSAGVPFIPPLLCTGDGVDADAIAPFAAPAAGEALTCDTDPALAAELDAHLRRSASPEAKPRPQTMTTLALAVEHRLLADKLARGAYSGRANDQARFLALDTEITHRAAEAATSRAGAGRLARHDQWKPLPMLPGQYEVRTRMYAPFDEFGIPAPGYDFEGDARGPSANLNLTSRVTQATIIDTRDPQAMAVISNRGYSDRSALHIAGRERTAAQEVPTTSANGTQLDRGVLTIGQDLRGSNPITPQAITPAIDTHNRARFEREGNTLAVHGTLTGDAFPNGEVLLTDAKGQTLLLHTFETDGWKSWAPLTRLPFDGADGMGSYSLSIRLDDDGNFAGVVDPSSQQLLSVSQWNDRQIIAAARK